MSYSYIMLIVDSDVAYAYYCLITLLWGKLTNI